MFANVGLVKTCIAASAIAENRIVAFGAAYGHMGESAVVQGSSAQQPFAGVAGLPKGVTALAGEPVDVIKSGIADVLYGGTVMAGMPLTSDSQGRAIMAMQGGFIVGYAQYAGTEGELGGVLLQMGILPALIDVPPAGGEPDEDNPDAEGAPNTAKLNFILTGISAGDQAHPPTGEIWEVGSNTYEYTVGGIYTSVFNWLTAEVPELGVELVEGNTVISNETPNILRVRRSVIPANQDKYSDYSFEQNPTATMEDSWAVVWLAGKGA